MNTERDGMGALRVLAVRPRQGSKQVVTITDGSRGDGSRSRIDAVAALETGYVIHIPELGFPIEPEERTLFVEGAVRMRSKNVSYDPSTGEVRGIAANDRAVRAQQPVLTSMLARYARFTNALIEDLVSEYSICLTQARTSFRPVEARGRRSRTIGGDDTLLHVDSFPSRPVAGRRILRVFTNVDPDGQSRRWKLGEPFEDLARRFLPRIRRPWLGERLALRALRITRGDRTPYDHYMLSLHDQMKRDPDYQRTVPHVGVDFPAGSTWICFSDGVSHAVMSGRYALEQTYYLGVDDMRDAALSPLRLLESLLGRKLV